MKPKISVITTSIRPNGLQRVREGLLAQTFTEFEWLVELNWTNQVDFNRACNRAIKRAQGHLIVFLQDYIKPNEDGLKAFYEVNDYTTFLTAPVGKIVRDSEDVLGIPHIDWDWRRDREVECDWSEWEIDWGAAPRKALIDIGGFDEALDQYWGFDNVNVGLRAERAGYTFRCLPDNDAVAVDHELIEPHPFRRLRNPEFHNQRLDEIRRGEWKGYI